VHIAGAGVAGLETVLALAARRDVRPGRRKSPAERGFSSAPKRTRTSTDHSVHKALNLAVAETLARDGVHVWDGDFYANALMRTLGLAEDGGAVRAGLMHYTTEDEVERLLNGVARLA
jgi:selenocysteine lyase/cysteine desulfurase